MTHLALFPQRLALPSATHTLPCGRGSVTHSKTRDTFRAARASERVECHFFTDPTLSRAGYAWVGRRPMEQGDKAESRDHKGALRIAKYAG